MKNSVFAWKTNVLQKIVRDNTAYLEKIQFYKKKLEVVVNGSRIYPKSNFLWKIVKKAYFS